MFSIPSATSFSLDVILLLVAGVVLCATCFKLVSSKSLLESIIVMSIFSLFISICYLCMDAPDVAMTEVALGACLSTCVLLNIARICGNEVGKVSKRRVALSFALCVAMVVALYFAATDLPNFGDEKSPLQTGISRYYVDNTRLDIGIPSIVAAVLASYRGYDTLGETTVIFIAGIAVLLILSRKKDEDEA